MNFAMLIENFIKALGALLGGIAVLYIIISGIRYVTAQGPEAAGAAKQSLTATLIGTAIVFSAWGIIYVVINLLKRIRLY